MRKREVPPPCDDSNCPGKPSRPPDRAKLEVLLGYGTGGLFQQNRPGIQPPTETLDN